MGPAGVAGASGPAGPAGANGTNGTNGADGATGPTGPCTGSPCDDTYLSNVTVTPTKTFIEWDGNCTLSAAIPIHVNYNDCCPLNNGVLPITMASIIVGECNAGNSFGGNSTVTIESTYVENEWLLIYKDYEGQAGLITQIRFTIADCDGNTCTKDITIGIAPQYAEYYPFRTCVYWDDIFIQGDGVCEIDGAQFPEFPEKFGQLFFPIGFSATPPWTYSVAEVEYVASTWTLGGVDGTGVNVVTTPGIDSIVSRVTRLAQIHLIRRAANPGLAQYFPSWYADITQVQK